MKSIGIFLVVFVSLLCLSSAAFAGPLGLFPNFHPGQKLKNGVSAVAQGASKALPGKARAGRRAAGCAHASQRGIRRAACSR